MKVIFVGMHNKPDLVPLSPLTKTGKIINKIIAKLPGVEFLKTNLYDIDHYPMGDDKSILATDWHYRIAPDHDDIIVLLGREVHINFKNNISELTTIKIAHPSSKFSRDEIEEYIDGTVNKILTKLST
jgi:hypothetical protein